MGNEDIFKRVRERAIRTANCDNWPGGSSELQSAIEDICLEALDSKDRRIAELEAECRKIDAETDKELDSLESRLAEAEGMVRELVGALKEIHEMLTEGEPKPIWVIDVAKDALTKAQAYQGKAEG